MQIPVKIDLATPINVGLEQGEEELLLEDEESVTRHTKHASLLPGEPAGDDLIVCS